MAEMTPAQILELPVESEAESPTVRAYLLDLLADLWAEKDGFQGKYGMTGESDWPYDLYRPLVHASLLDGASEENLSDGWGLPEPARQQADQLIAGAIRELGQPLQG